MNGYEWKGVSEQLYWSCLEVDWRMVEDGDRRGGGRVEKRKEV
jgi:hypothetical protein